MVAHASNTTARARWGGRRGFLALLGGVLTLLGGVVVATAGSASRSGASSVGGDRSKLAQLEQRIATDGARVQRLVERYDQAQATATALTAKLKVTRAHLVADRREQGRTAAELRAVAVDAYVTNGGMASPLLTGSASTQGMASVYVDVAGQRLRSAVESFQYAQHQTRATASALSHQRARAEATMRALRPDQQAAERAVLADERLLAGVKGNLHSLLAAAAARQQAAELAAERRMAARAAAAVAAREATTTTLPAASSTAATAPTLPPPPPSTTTPPPSSPPTPTVSSPSATPAPTSGGYADPLRAIGGLSPERIDMGVDFGGYGPIYAIGDGVVESTVNGGWPGGTFIAYRLTDGPAAGLTVYAAEDIYPTVQVGQTVTAGTQIGTVYGGPDGIETGWAAPGGLGDTMASTAGQFDGGNSTAYGANFSQLLQALGAPGGILQNSPATGVLPAGWPSW